MLAGICHTTLEKEKATKHTSGKSKSTQHSKEKEVARKAQRGQNKDAF
jgi:hypothetical protein